MSEFMMPPERKEWPPLDVAFRSRASSLHPKRNEDNGCANAKKGAMAVFDGMGKGLAGDCASAAACDVIRKDVEGSVESPSLWSTEAQEPLERSAVMQEVKQTLANMHRAIRASLMSERYQHSVKDRFQEEFLQDHPDASGKLEEEPFRSEFAAALIEKLIQADKDHGSTAVIAKIWTDGTKRFITYGWIGDSRLYRWRAQGEDRILERLTVDDTIINVAVTAGLIKDDSDASIDTKISFAQVEQAFRVRRLGLRGLGLFYSLFKREHKVTDPKGDVASLPPISLINYSSSLLAALGMQAVSTDDFKVRTEEIQEGDCFVALTDQMTKFGGDEALREVLEAYPSGTADEIVDALQQKADLLAAEVSYDDDSTVSVLKT